MKEVCRAIITNSQGNVLLGKRARGMAANLYALIGGKPDEGESIQDAVIREVKEETGLDFNPAPYLEEIDTKSVPGETWLVTYFVGDSKGELKLKADEVIDVIYVSEKDLEDIPIAFDHKDILKEYFNNK
jgi:8-oxo-dGTP diphosphatase